MAIHELKAKLRTGTGKGVARKARRAGQVPAVAYGFQTTPTTLMLDTEEFVQFIHRYNVSTALVKLKVENAAGLDTKVFLIKDLQLHHIERTPLAVDLVAIDMSKSIKVEVPIIFSGTAKGIKTGGLVTPLVRDLEVNCLPTNIPSSIPCDVTELLEGDTWYVKSLVLPEGVTLAVPADTPFVACTTPRQTTPEEEAAAAKAAEEAAGEGAEGAEGGAAKPGAKPDAKAEGKGDAKAAGKGDSKPGKS